MDAQQPGASAATGDEWQLLTAGPALKVLYRHKTLLDTSRHMPADMLLAATGNWLMPGLWHRYMPLGEWVFWVDVDVLVAGPQNGQEALMPEPIRPPA